MSDPSLGELLDLLRSKGVRVFSGPHGIGSIHVEFGPAEVKDVPTKPVPDEEKCLCGCPVHAHVNGLCIFNCGPEKCAPPE